MENSWAEFTINESDLDEWFGNDIAFYKLPRERISTLLLAQLYIIQKMRTHNIFYITDEIKYLEGIVGTTKTEKEDKFKGNLLKGLWKKHFYSDRFLFRNISNYLLSKKGSNKFDNKVKELFSENEGEYLEDKTIKKIADFASFGIFKNKLSQAGNKKNCLTGEWIIFFKHNGSNYYLCIARHDTGDDKIRDQILSTCVNDFPFLPQYFS